VTAAPRSLGEWRDHFATRGPGPAAEAWLLRLGAVDPATQRAALCGLPDAVELRRRFERAWGRRDLALAGVPFLAKDLLHLAAQPTLAGSRALGRVLAPPEHDSELIRRARDLAGGVCCGKTQLNELALGLSGENPHHGDCPHPADPARLSGGSSSGSAWAVGAGLVPLALATDTAGSVRVPAAWCGVHGLRLPAGLLCGDIFPLAPGFDSAGWIAATAADLAEATAALLGRARAPLGRGLWVGDPGADVPAAVLERQRRAALELGAEQDEPVARDLRAALAGSGPTYATLGGAAAARVHAPWMEDLGAAGDPAVVARLRAGAARSPGELAAAEEGRARVTRALRAVLDTGWDWLALPCTAGPAVARGGHDEGVRRQLLALNAPASLAGLPALARPVGLADGLTAGIQLVTADVDRLVAATVRAAG